MQIYTRRVAKHLVDLDEEALAAARGVLGTTTIRATVNEALRQIAAVRQPEVQVAINELAALELDDRSEAWR